MSEEYKKRLFYAEGRGVKNAPPGYLISKIPKGKNRYRIIYIPKTEKLKKLKGHLSYLEDIFTELDKENVSFAFIKGKNCVLNALQHIGYNFSISFDLEDFFDNITIDHVKSLIDKKVIKDCFVDGAPRQGLPTSPMISNIALLKLDKDITNALDKLNIEHVYTRYADDLTISFDKRKDAGKIIFLTKKILHNHKFDLNHKKTKLQDIRNGRIIITGVAIDKYGLYPTRKTLKKIRAAKHQKNQSSLKGLLEWSKCNLPRSVSGNTTSVKAATFEDQQWTKDRRIRFSNTFSHFSTIDGFDYAALVSYLPTRYQASNREWENRRMIWSFKDGKNSKSVAYHLAKALKKVYKEYELAEVLFTVIPASTKEKNRKRYRVFLKHLCKITGMQNGYKAIRIKQDREASHASTSRSVDKTSGLLYDKAILSGKRVLLFDDIYTTGASFVQNGERIEQVGVKEVTGIFLGKTVNPDWE